MAGFKEIIKHSGNYFLASLATRALAFISIPIYTRLISPEDYGILSVFLGVTGIVGTILAFCTDQSISRYYFDQKDSDDFKKFTGTSVVLALGFFLLNSILLILFAGDFANLVGLKKQLIYLIIPFAFFNSVSLTFEQIYGPLKRSRSIAFSSLSRVYIGFAFSVGIVFMLKTEKYYGPIIGQLIGGLALLIYWIRSIKPYITFSFDKSYLKYIFSYSIPLIPYVLSGVIIEQFGKIAIGNVKSASEAGFYSLALTISSLVSIMIAISHQAWNPYYFEYMNAENYEQHDKDQNKIFRATIFVAIGVASFGNEIGVLLARKSFSGSLYLIPVFVIGYIFYQLAYVYMRNFSFTRKTQYLTLTVLLSGISNVIFNFYLIPRYGEKGAAISFVLSYILMAFTAWALNKFLVKHYGAPLKIFLIPFMVSLPFFVALYFISYVDFYVLKILLKLFLTGTLGIVLFWHLRFDIIHFLKTFKRNK